EPDGSAGTASAVLDDCALAGADGLTRAPDGSLVFAVNFRHEVLRWSPHAGLTTAYAGDPLDFPASVVSRNGGLVVSNAAVVPRGNGGPTPRGGGFAGGGGSATQEILSRPCP